MKKLSRDMSDTPPTMRIRLESVDVVRGVIMIIMALDHTRDFFGIPGQSPTNLATATAALFLTRWVTYFCAPVFFLSRALARTSPCGGNPRANCLNSSSREGCG